MRSATASATSRPPRGVGYAQAAGTAVRLMARMVQLGRSGVDVKDIASLDGAGSPDAIG